MTRPAVLGWLLPLLAAVSGAIPASAAAADPAGLPEAEATRRFFEGGPVLLVPEAERERLAAAPEEERARFAREFLARDPDPATAANELAQAVERRRRLVFATELSFFDDRGRLLFLRGTPTERTVVDCGETFRPLEIWRWGTEPAAARAVLYQPHAGAHWSAWRPTTSKRLLFTEEMEYLLEQVEELNLPMRGRRRPDRQLCDKALEVDRVTGVAGLFDFERDRMRDADVEALFAPPADLAGWARDVLAAPAATAESPALPVPEVRVGFPEARDQRLLARFRLTLPAGLELGVVEEASGRESRLAVRGVLEQESGIFDQFQARFVFASTGGEQPVVLEVERLLRPRSELVARLEVRDEVTGAKAYFDWGFEVPAQPVPEPETAAVPVVKGEEIGLARAVRRDTVLLLPPAGEVVFGLWRAEALVAGDRIRKVVFLLDGKPQLTRAAPPWTAELRLPNVPDETIVRVEALDAEGNVVAADELLLNEPQNEPKIRLLAPPRGRAVSGPTRARAAVVVPEGRRVERVEFRLNDEVIATLERPPWETTVDVPAEGELTYLTVTAVYEDGSRVEDFRVLNAPEFLEQVEVDLVELFVTVTDRAGRPVEGLEESELRVLDNGRPQRISRFEQVRALPLTLGLVLDTSGSMRESLGEAKRAASDFLEAVMTPRDRCFAVGISGRPTMLMPLTPDAKSIEVAFRDQPALGNTALHDSLVYSLYQFRGIRGRKALVLLSDGDDTSSLVPFEDALAFAQRSGVAIYTIGLDIPKASFGIRGKLDKLAAETGGRVFFVEKAAELAGVYDDIELELRSQYFVAFAPDPPPQEGERHTIEVVARDGKLDARSARGYTP